MNWNIVIKIILAVVALIVVSKYVAALLIPIMPPLGVICLILIYLGIVAWLLVGPDLIKPQ